MNRPGGRLTVMKPRHLFRFRFRLRTIFILMLILSIPLGWVAAQLKWIRDRYEAKSSGSVYVDFGTKKTWYDPWYRRTAHLPWSLKLFGEHPVTFIMLGGDLESHEGQRQAKQIKALFPESAIVFIEPSGERKTYTWISDPLNLRPLNVRAKRP